MADGLDLVAVGVADVGTVVIRMVVRPEAGRAFVGPAVRERRGVKRVDRGARVDLERGVDAVPRPGVLAIERRTMKGFSPVGVPYGEVLGIRPDESRDANMSEVIPFVQSDGGH